MPIELDLPPSFTGLPVSTSADRTAEQAWALAGQVTEHTGGSREDFSGYLNALTPGLADQGVRLFGRFAVGAENPGLATLTVAMLGWPDADLQLLSANRSAIAAALAEQYRERHPDADTRAIDLTVGPAMAAIHQGDFHLPPEMTHDGDEVRPVLRIEVQIPLPDGSGLIVLNVVSTDDRHWETVLEQTRTIANSVRTTE